MPEPVLDFGKYNGTPISKVPKDHIKDFFRWYENASPRTQLAFKTSYENLKNYLQ